MSRLQRRINSALNVIDINKLELILNLNFLKNTNKFKKINDFNKYEYFVEELAPKNYDNKILELYNNDDMKTIMNKDKNISKLINVSFYGDKIISDFISSRIIRNILNNIFVKNIYKFRKRTVIIFTKSELKEDFIKKIDSIFNFFDLLTGKENMYYLEIFLSDKKKYFNENLNSIDPDNINSGATLPGVFIYLWRKEEIIKVLIHEIVHYLDLDMRDYQDNFKILYKEINLDAKMTNPNEAYTEILALFLMSVWSYYNRGFNEDINNFVSKRLTIELGWSYHQISKILKYFKCYNNYDELFSNKCTFRQRTNVLSYFILKTYFLQNINLVLDEFRLDNLYMTEKNSNRILNVTNLQDEQFIKNINNIMKLNIDSKKYDMTSSRMTCLN